MKQLKPAILVTLFLMVFTGFVFPYFLYVVGRVMPHQANGSMVADSKGNIIGSSLIAQPFALPKYFHPRPSATGDLGYGTFDKDHSFAGSAGSNLGPNSDKLINGIHKKTPDGKDDPSNYDGVVDLVKAYRAENNLSADAKVPADAVTRSGSGIDPDISPENAYLQAARVASARHMSVPDMKKLIDDNTTPRFLGVFGDPTVNVLNLNLMLDKSGK
ncbi:MAG: K(+)-transporting ATPase subunit C [Fimbriimonas sp.]|nr:K(+)-transporting ATPase subunit C [Fimbriimonas sp.]